MRQVHGLLMEGVDMNRFGSRIGRLESMVRGEFFTPVMATLNRSPQI